MIYQLPTGKAIEISVEQFFKMSDLDFESMIANDAGSEMSDPFSKSVLRSKAFSSIGSIEEIDPEDLTEEELEELESALNEDELRFDPDFIDYDNLEQ